MNDTIENLRKYNLWRRGDELIEQPDPKDIGIWIDEICEIAEKLERERDDYMERCRTALSERDSWRMRAEQKYAMRRELEELLGVDQKDASDEQFQKGLDAIKNIIGERDEAREAFVIATDQMVVAQGKLREANKERDKARAELEMWRDGNIMHQIHRDELEKAECERDEARRSLEHITEYGTEEINVAVDLRQRLATALVERDEAREVARLLKATLDLIKNDQLKSQGS
jgi:hypothetical protein